MKILKYLFLLIIIIVVAGLAYQNQEYFKHAVSLKIDVKDFNYVIPEIPNGAYLGICFLLGLILAGMSILTTRWDLKKVIKSKDSDIAELNSRVKELKIDLAFFTNDPYIKKGLESQAVAVPAAEPAPVETQTEAVVAENGVQPDEPAREDEPADAGDDAPEDSTGDTTADQGDEKEEKTDAV